MSESRIELYFFFAVIIAALVLAFFIFLPFLSALAVSAVLAVIFYPAYVWLLRYLRWRGLAAGITVLLILLIVFIPLSFLAVLLFEEARVLFVELNGESSGGVNAVLAFIESEISRFSPGFTLDVSAYLREALNWVMESLGSIFAGTAQAALSLIIGIIGLFYFLRDGAWFREIFVRYSPLRDTYDDEIVDRVRLTINSILKGSLLIALIQGVLSGIGFSLFGVPNPVLWGSVAALGALIPGVGTTIVFVPAILYLFFSAGVFSALGLLLWGAVAVGLIDNALGPVLIGRGVRIHPFLILLAVLGGLKFFGPVGFLLGPIALSILLALAEIYNLLIRHGEALQR